MLGGFSLFPFLAPILKAIFASSALILMLVFSFYSVLKQKVSFWAVCSSLLVLSILLSFFYFDFYAKPADRFDGVCDISGKITDIREISEEDELYSYRIKTYSVNGAPFSSYTLEFTTDAEKAKDVDVGCVVNLKGIITPHDDQTSDMSAYYFSLGVMGKIDLLSRIEIKYQSIKPISYYMSEIRTALTEYAVSVSNDATGTMLSALLFGERQALSPSVKASFTNIGISHILALSGMHVALLCLAVNRLLLLARVKRRARGIVTIVLCLLYMVLTGMSVSVVRASLMMIISILLSLVMKTSDSITSLFLSVFIIILFAPYTVYSVSLWLSAFATLGVIISLDLVDTFHFKKGLLSRVARFLFTSVASSVFALMSTMLISACIFKSFSPISLLSTLIFSILIEIIMYIGALMLIFGKIIPISFVLNPIVDFTENLAHSLSSLKLSTVSVTSFIIPFIIITTLIYLVLLVINVKSKPTLFLTAAIIHVVSVVPIVAYGAASIGETNLYYTYENEEDFVVVKCEDTCHIISYGNSYYNNAYEIYEILNSQNIHKIDTYITLDISKNSAREIDTLISKIPVSRVMIPEPLSDTGEYADNFNSLTEHIKAREIELSVFGDTAYHDGDFSFLPVVYKNAYDSSDNAAFFVGCGAKNVLFLSDGFISSEYSRTQDELLPHCDALIFGKMGVKKPGKGYLDSFHYNIREIVFSGENTFITPETAEKYEENGCKLYSHPSFYRLFD